MRPRFRLAALSMVVATVAAAPVVHAQSTPSARAQIESPTAKLIRAHTTQILAWFAGECTGEVVAAACYPARASTISDVTVAEPGFDWVDAGLGASATLGVVLIASGAGLAASRQRRQRYARSR